MGVYRPGYSGHVNKPVKEECYSEKELQWMRRKLLDRAFKSKKVWMSRINALIPSIDSGHERLQANYRFFRHKYIRAMIWVREKVYEQYRVVEKDITYSIFVRLVKEIEHEQKVAKIRSQIKQFRKEKDYVRIRGLMTRLRKLRREHYI